jgi:hypothetical protein
VSSESPARPGGKAPAKPPISQAELERYQEARAQAERHRETLDALRQDLLQRLEAGNGVEPGSLTAQVRHVPMRQLSGPKLVPLLGAEAVEELRAAVEPTVQVQLIVQSRGGGDAVTNGDDATSCNGGHQTVPWLPPGVAPGSFMSVEQE